MTRLALLRHGHTPWNREGRIQGRTDIPLDDEARAHLSGLHLPDGFDQFAVVSSPLLRAFDTGQIVTGRAPQTIDALIEMNWGAWEGAHGVTLKADPTSGYTDIEHWGWDFRPPDGESLSDVRDRLQPWLTSLKHDTLAVCHIGIMRVILAMAHGWSFTGTPPFAVKRDRLFVIDIEGAQMTAHADPVRLPRRSA